MSEPLAVPPPDPAPTLTAEPVPPLSAPPAVPAPPARPRLSRAVWVFTALLVVLIAGLSALGVAYVNNKRTADRVLAEQSSHIAQLTEKTGNQEETITRKDAQLHDLQVSTDRLTQKNASYATCKKSVQDLVDAARNKVSAAIVPALAAIARDCKEVA